MISNSLGSSAYFGAQFADDVVVFENINFGNAAYVLYEGWKEMSKLSRTELLRDENSFDRIVHSKGWEKRLGICHSSRTGKISVKKFWGCVAKAANRSPDPPPKKLLNTEKGRGRELRTTPSKLYPIASCVGQQLDIGQLSQSGFFGWQYSLPISQHATSMIPG